MTNSLEQYNTPLRDRVLGALRAFGPGDPSWLTCHLYECEYLSKTFWAHFADVLSAIWSLHEEGQLLIDKRDLNVPIRLPNQQQAAIA